MRPHQVLIFVLSIIVGLAVIVLVFPKNGIKITKEFVLYFPNFDEIFTKEPPSINVDSIVKNQLDIDSLENLLNDKDSSQTLDVEELKKLITPLEFPDGDSTLLYPFFAKLDSISSIGKVRIMHYGDSQIEVDRITSIIRYKLQERFGGYGLGLSTVGKLYAQFSIIQDNSDNWVRYTSYGKIDSLVKHDKYGAMAAFSRFTPLRDSLEPISENVTEAWIEFKKSNFGYKNTRKFKSVNLYYGNSILPVEVEILINDSIVDIDTLKVDTGLNILSYNSTKYIDNIRFNFKGMESPDFYGISFEDTHGVIMDNIALRGSSGTMFTRINAQQLAEMYSILGTDLFILQFGGNVMPFLKDKEQAVNLSMYFYYQIQYLKSLVPNAQFIVIGPSDMATKVKDKFVTYPLLETMRDELKKVTLESGSAYWDTYEAMGGKNSMRAFVFADPPLASTDFIHFTPLGAQIIANMFYNALILEYTQYSNNLNKNIDIE